MKKYARSVSAMLAVLTLLAVLGGCSKETPSQEPEPAASETVQEVEPEKETPVELPEPEEEALVLTVLSVENEGDFMVVDTTFGQVKYPFAFSDLIEIEAVNEENLAALVFLARIGDHTYPLFTVSFGDCEGIPLGTLMLPDEEIRNVSVQFATVEETELGDNLNSYYAAQEVFNDVIVSLEENAHFTAAE